MKSRNYYKTFYQRKNIGKIVLTEMIQDIFVTCRSFIEVFTRKNFGERYFAIGHCIFLACILAAIPYWLPLRGYYTPKGLDVVTENPSWYAFILLYLIFAWKRQNEIKRLPSVFDFERFSLSTGSFQPFMTDIFKNIKINGKSILLDEHKDINCRRYEILLEPLIPLIIGILLIVFKQPIGIVLTLSSIFYALSYRTAYIEGDHFMMDKIDEMICNEGLVSTFVTGQEESHKGFRPYGRRPKDQDKRAEMYERMTNEFAEETEFEEVK